MEERKKLSVFNFNVRYLEYSNYFPPLSCPHGGTWKKLADDERIQ